MEKKSERAGANPRYKRLGNIIAWCFLAAMMVWIFVPMFWSITTTFKTPIETYRVPVKMLPENFSFHNYVKY